MNTQMPGRDGELDRLVAGAQLGDETSRGRLLHVVRAGVLRYLLARGLPDHDAQDLAQDICLGVLTALPGWRADGRPLWALVFTIARNKVTDRARALAARKDLPMGPDGYDATILRDPRPDPAQLAEDDEGAGWVQAQLATLPATQRDVLLLRVIVGLSAAETAAALTLTVGSVRVLQHRAITALRRRLITASGGTQ